MAARVVIIGGGVGGMVTANRLARKADRDVEIVVLDGHGDHIYQPGLLYVPTGTLPREKLVRDLRPLIHPRVRLEVRRAVGVDPESRTVEIQHGDPMPYDFLVLATGSRVDTRSIPGYHEAALHFHCQRRAFVLREAIADCRSGTIVIGAGGLPYKCPLAPAEMALLLDAHLRRTGRRQRIQLHFVHPGPSLGPVPAAEALAVDLFKMRDIETHMPFETAAIDPDSRAIHSRAGERLSFDVLILTPPHTVAPFLKNCGLVNDTGFIPTDPHTLKVRDRIYAVGDNADLPVPKLGSAAVRQAHIVAENVCAEIEGRSLDNVYDGHSSSFFETGGSKTAMIETAYDTPPTFRRPALLHFIVKRAINRFYFNLISRR